MPVAWDFSKLIDADVRDLLVELTETHQELANLHEEIAFNKLSEIENPPLKAVRIELEGHRDALIEKKWLITRLLDARTHT